MQGFRLSPQQRSVWSSAGADGSSALRVLCQVRIRGGVDAQLLRRSLDELVRRHEVLRTRFRLLPGRSVPVQVVDDDVPAGWREEDGDSDRARALAEELWREPYDPQGGAVLRAALVRLSPDEHLLLLSLPALCADSGTLDNLVRELGAAYAVLAAGGAPDEEEILQYADLSQWLNDLLDAEEGRGFWRRQRVPRPDRLPAGRLRPDGTVEPHTLTLALDPARTERVRAVADACGATPAAVLLACWEALLWRLDGGRPLSVACRFDGRNYAELQGVVGPLARYLPLAVEPRGADSFADHLRQAEARLEELRQWQEYFDEGALADREGEKGSLPHLPYAFAYDARGETHAAGGVAFTVEARREYATRSLAQARGMETAEGITLAIDFDAAAVSRAEAERLLERLATLLDAATRTPDAPLDALALLGENERRELLVDFNRTAREYPSGVCAHTLVERQAALTPDAVAVRFRDRELTFAELDARAGRLARSLRVLGVGPEVCVGVHAHRTPELLVGLLAVLKAGGAYVPLDPAQPARRLAAMLEDARAPVLLTERALSASLPEHGARVVFLDEEPPAGPEASAAEAGPGNLAYVLYTSGSTGRPKGVMVPHQGLVNYLLWSAEAYDLAGRGGAPVHSSIGFDLTVTSLLAPLVAGRTVTLLAEEEGVEGLGAALLGGTEFGAAKLTPSHLRVLERQLPAGAAVGTAALVIGGEALYAEDLASWRERHPGVRLINEYGPTETVVGCCVYEVDARTPATGSVPIGRPVANTRLYVLDEAMEPVPAGVVGELYVGGAGVARGYAGLADRTAAVFVPDPFGADAGARLYRTGDRVRHGADGNLEFLGRVDGQVKVRGYRIELGEIESVLREHPAVHDAAVMVREDVPGQRRLVAYVAPHAGSEGGEAELRAFLEEALPAYMVPAAIAVMDALPLSSNGKVDMAALPAPEELEGAATEPYVAPRNRTEEILASIWADVLRREVGVRDNFFALGGDSILSIQVLAAAREQGLTFIIPDLFANPTVEGLAKVVQQADGSGEAPELEPFALVSEADRGRLPAGVEDAYPLSSLQHGMLFHSEFSPDSAIYHDITTFRLRAPMRPEAMAEAVRRLVERHEVLRTSFDLHRFSEPLQLVHREVPLPLQVEEMGHLAPDEQAKAVREWIEAEKRRPFDWTRAPLVRFQVHRRGEAEFQFTISFHHAVLDGWSVSSLLSELFRHYLALARGEEVETAGPGVRFREFIALERETLASEASRAYWSGELDGCTPGRIPRRTEPRDGGGAPEAGRIGIRPVPVDAALSTGLKELARRLDVSLKSVLLAAHLRVMGLLHGDLDVVTGVVTHGRPERAGGEQVAGLFLNTVPLRGARWEGSWEDMVRWTFRKEHEAAPHRRFPLSRIQRLHGTEPLFETVFNHMHFRAYREALALDSLQVVEGDFFEETNYTFAANFSQDVVTSDVGLYFSYDRRELQEAQVDEVAGYYLRVLRAMAADPSGRVDAVTLLSGEELDRQMGAWNATAADTPRDRSFHALFEERAAGAPEAVAVVSEEERLTYGELNARANRLAHLLRARGVGPEAIVGLATGRSTDMVVGMLGILKAGGAYLPLDPDYPAERLRLILEDAGVSVAVASGERDSALAGVREVVSLRRDAALLAAQPGHDPGVEVGPEGLAYVIYTSGSTGRPKGVLVPHRGLCNLAEAQVRTLGNGPGSRVLQFSSLNFDAATFEIVMALYGGGELHLAGRDALLPGPGLTRLLRERAVTHLTIPPSALAATPVEPLPELRALVVAGEACPAELAARWRGGRRFFNAYGPTEATIWASTGEARGEGAPPIGRPVPNVRLYVLDRGMNPVPAGTPGELYIGGTGVVRGYLGRAELTAERFLPDPFGGEAGARLYRTGDRARHRGDGELEFLGRVDEQVKIRGFRIEPGEVEAVLGAHPALRDAVVSARPDARGELRLVAYVVPDAPGDLSTGALRAYLAERLPDYMVPAVFVPLGELPLTPNGKVDRRALPEPEGSRGAIETRYVPPRDPVEEALVREWEEVLEMREVGVHDDFFELGGHSLSATRLVARVRELFGTDLPLRTLFESPTVAQVARHVAAAQGSPAPATPITPRPGGGSAPLSFAQQRLWFHDRLHPGSAVYNIPAAVRLDGPLDTAAMAAALGEIVRRHEALRTVFAEGPDGPEQRVLEAEPFDLPVVELDSVPDEEPEAELLRLVRREARRPFSLERGPLLRAVLVRLGAEDHVLVLCMHHIVSDGWSVGVLLREFAALYAAFLEGRPSPLPELPVQYADYALWERLQLQGDRLEEQLAFWKARLGGAPAVLELSGSRARTGKGGVRTFHVPADTAARLRALSRDEGATLFMTLLAAFDLLLARYSGSEDVVVGTNVANRGREEVEGLIGFFINNLVLRTDLSGNPTFRELLGRVRETCLDAYAHQDLSFDRLVEELQPRRIRGVNPLFQAMFVLQNTPMPELELPGLRLSPMQAHPGTATFDLLLNVSETREGMVGKLEHDLGLLDESTAAQMLADFTAFLDEVAENPDQPVGSLAGAGAGESQSLVQAFNDDLV
ncbi:MAG TPA: amino acid adenylation domain-containing protein [Longimicrobiaceae bacterium]|nr:amino acid adenylation domain-containing protein [Longimicrobiaceae bacterium]